MTNEVAFRDVLTDAIHYWEWRRILYNGVLASIVIFYFIANWPFSKGCVTFDLFQGIFLLAVLANIAYCAAYVADIAAQLSDVRASWIRYRWVLLGIGMVFASIITRTFSQGFFGCKT